MKEAENVSSLPVSSCELDMQMLDETLRVDNNSQGSVLSPETVPWFYLFIFLVLHSSEAHSKELFPGELSLKFGQLVQSSCFLGGN
jgi:hypothetical protein